MRKNDLIIGLKKVFVLGFVLVIFTFLIKMGNYFNNEDLTKKTEEIIIEQKRLSKEDQKKSATEMFVAYSLERLLEKNKFKEEQINLIEINLEKEIVCLEIKNMETGESYWFVLNKRYNDLEFKSEKEFEIKKEIRKGCLESNKMTSIKESVLKIRGHFKRETGKNKDIRS